MATRSRRKSRTKSRVGNATPKPRVSAREMAEPPDTLQAAPPVEDCSALYFPHVQIDDPELVRSSLLLWDRLYYIAPEREMRPYDEQTPRELARGLDVIAQAHIPDGREKHDAHQMILKVVDSTPRSAWEQKGIEDARFGFEMFGGKFMYQTLDELRRRDLGTFVGDDQPVRDFGLRTRLGLTIMAILAACCGRSAGQTFTDRTWDYLEIFKVIRPRRESGLVSKAMSPQLVDRLMRASFEVMDLSNVRLERLIQLREKNSSEFNELRHGYVRVLREFVRARSTARAKGYTANEIEGEFIKQARGWARDLQKILEVERVKRRRLLLSVGSQAALGVKHIATGQFDGALEILSAFVSLQTGYAGLRKGKVIRKESPVGYLHFLSKLR
jgi:hypothetical protein